MLTDMALTTARQRTPLGPAYWRLWWASAVSTTGDGVLVAALPLLAVTITRNPLMISLVTAAEFLPWLLLSLPAGVLVDRHDRATLMWRAQVLQGSVIAVLAVLVLLHWTDIAVLAVAAFGLGVGEVVFSNASQSVLPQLVRAEQLPEANGNQYAVQTIGQEFAGPPLGSLLTRRLGQVPSLVIAMGAVSVIYVGIGLAPNAPVLAALEVCNGFVVTMWNIVTVTLRQRIVPNEMLGRVNSAYRMIGWGLMPVGAVAGGLVAHVAGLRAPYVIAGVLCGITTFAALPLLSGAPGSHRESNTATAEKPADHQNATWNASASVAGCAAMAPSRITARTAVPNEPPICCAVLVSTLECGICCLSRPM
jgi:MFS family permease